MADMSQAVSDNVMIYIHIALNIVARFIISVSGVATNLINMVIFSKLGLKDSMSVGLFSLSLTDFLVTSVQLASCVVFILDILFVNIGTDAIILGYVTLGWAIIALYETSCWITAVVSIERCYCVVSPFTVKQVFTRYRCIATVMTIYFIHIGFHVPIYLYERMELVKIPILPGNYTTSEKPEMFATQINHKVQLIEFILDISAGVAMWLLSQAIIIICAVWMAYSLEASSKVRRNTSSSKQDKTNNEISVNSKQSSTLSDRERRLVRVVIFLAITLTCCNVPKMITIVLYYTFPGASSGAQENLSTLLWTVALTFGSVGCSMSFLVYIQLNANFRRMFTSTFRLNVEISNDTSIQTTNSSLAS